ncbi:MAG: hypothetical protein U0992_00965 [Planctomycetaceae bacterium]
MRRVSTPAVRRRGSLIPAVAVALLIVGAAAAIALDRLWIDAARIELLTAAESAALAGAAQLADDRQLATVVDVRERLAEVRTAAVTAAAQNYVAGQPLRVPTTDVHIGRLVQDRTGREVFLETDNAPTSVAVFAARQRSGANPVALFLRTLTKAQRPLVQVSAEASIDNRVVGVAAIQGGSIPALPLAALEIDPSGVQPQTWVRQIEEHGGADQFGYDQASGLVINQPDGLPELTLLSAPLSASSGTATPTNVRLLDFATGLRDDRLAAQVAAGLRPADLVASNGVLRFDGLPLLIGCESQIEPATRQALAAAIGQPRICCVFSAVAGNTSAVSVPRMVAVRVMSVREVDSERVEIIVQPTVVTTRTAIFAANAEVANPYVYKLQLTH